MSSGEELGHTEQIIRRVFQFCIGIHLYGPAISTAKARLRVGACLFTLKGNRFIPLSKWSARNSASRLGLPMVTNRSSSPPAPMKRSVTVRNLAFVAGGPVSVVKPRFSRK
jgi:hypothetical protein